MSEIIDVAIVSNNLFNNFMPNIVKLTNAKSLDDLWRNLAFRENMLVVLGKHEIKSKHYIFINELIDGDFYEQKVHSSVINLGKMSTAILAIVLYCNNEKLIKRVESKDKSRKVKLRIHV